MKFIAKIKGLLVQPNKLPIEITFNNSLKEKQLLVDGSIEYTERSYYPNVVFICNEEGKLLNLPYNRDIGGDIIVGDFLIVGDKEGSDISLTKKQIEEYKKIFNEKSISKTREAVFKYAFQEKCRGGMLC